MENLLKRTSINKEKIDKMIKAGLIITPKVKDGKLILDRDNELHRRFFED